MELSGEEKCLILDALSLLKIKSNECLRFSVVNDAEKKVLEDTVIKVDKLFERF